MGAGTAKISISGDWVEGWVGGTKFNFKSHGDLVDTFIPPPSGIGFGDYTFRVDLITLECEAGALLGQ